MAANPGHSSRKSAHGPLRRDTGVSPVAVTRGHSPITWDTVAGIVMDQMDSSAIYPVLILASVLIVSVHVYLVLG